MSFVDVTIKSDNPDEYETQMVIMQENFNKIRETYMLLQNQVLGEIDVLAETIKDIGKTTVEDTITDHKIDVELFELESSSEPCLQKTAFERTVFDHKCRIAMLANAYDCLSDASNMVHMQTKYLKRTANLIQHFPAVDSDLSDTFVYQQQLHDGFFITSESEFDIETEF